MKNRNSFLLFEVLIAILIASTALIVLMQGLGNALRGGSITEGYFKASFLAGNQLAMLEKNISVKEYSDSGRFSSEEDPETKFTWEEKISPITINTLFGLMELPVCEVRVSVKWKEKNNERSVTLYTYLLVREEERTER